jgi:hypothetical protein
MLKNFFSVLIIIAIIISFGACSNKDDKQKPKEDTTKTTKQIQGTSQADSANKPVEATEEGNPPANIKMKACFNSITMSEFISRGAEVVFDWRTKSFDISQLIPYAPDPTKIWVMGRFFNPWELVDIVKKGAKIIISCKDFPSFTINALISEAKNTANVIVVSYNCCCAQTQEFVEKGATVIVGKPHEPFHILSYIRAGGERVIVNVRGYTSHWIMNFVQRGGSIKIDNSFNAFDVLTFAKAGKERVSIMANGFNYNHVKMFLKEGAKIVIGRTWFSPHLYKSFDLVDIIKVNPANVTIIGDFYEEHEIAEFIKLGAKIKFFTCRCWERDKFCDVDEWLSGQQPSSEPTLGQKNLPMKERKNYRPKSCYKKR